MGSTDNSAVFSNLNEEKDQSRVIDGRQIEDHLRTKISSQVERYTPVVVNHSEVNAKNETEGNDPQDLTLVMVEEHENKQGSTQIEHKGLRYDQYSQGELESTVGKRETAIQISRTRSSSQSSDTLDGSSLSLCSVISSFSIQRPCESQTTNTSFQQLPEDFSEDQRVLSSALIRSALIPRYTFSQEIILHPWLGLCSPPVSYSQSLHCLETDHVEARRPQILTRVAHGRKESKLRVCYHRSYLTLDGPPCYLCSMSDLPPKYKIQKSAEQNAKNKFMNVLQCLASLKFARSLQILCNGRSAGIIYNTAQNPNVILSGSPNLQMSLSETREHRAYWIDNNPEVRHQTSVSYQSHTQASTSLDSNLERVHNSQDTPTTHTSLSPPVPTIHRTSILCEVPPPYSPPNPRSLNSGYFVQPEQGQEHQQRENVNCIMRHFRCYRSLLYNILYSVLLATLTSITLVGYDQPVFLLASIILFLTVFVFMPIIWCLKFLLRWKAGDFRRYDATTRRSIAIPFPLP